MKRLLLFLVAAILFGAATAAPRDLYVAGQSGGDVKVYNCNTKETKTIKGYLRNIGVDSKGNVYVLVCNVSHGWGNYYVYRNFESTPYQSLVEDANGIYSSMAMRVKGNDVIVAGVQSKGFNSKGYESRQFGYVNRQCKYMTGYDRKSLKRDYFEGYKKVVGSTTNKGLASYGNENNSHNPQGDYLSCLYRVEAVDYCNGDIYTTGWGEREYSETPVGYHKYYLVRRCPRVWKNGAEVVAQYENRTGAAWNINVFNMRGKEYIFTSGHQRSMACAWEGNVDQFDAQEYGYPGIYSETVLYVASNNDGPIFCRIYLCRKGNKTIDFGRFMQNGKMVGAWGGGGGEYYQEEVVAGNDCYYELRTKSSNNTIEVERRYEYDTERGPLFKRSETVCQLPSSFKVSNPKMAVRE